MDKKRRDFVLNTRKYTGVVILSLFFFCSAIPKVFAESNEPIRIILNNWTSQLVLSKVTGGIFESLGYKIEYVPSSIHDQWGALAHGIDHVQIEVWEGTMSDKFIPMVNKGQLTDAGNHVALTREEWWYPEYIEENCPGLPDWKALKACAHIFATPSTAPSGRYLAGPWEKPEALRIKSLGLDFKVSTVENSDELWVALNKAVAHKTPIVLFNWSPNWVEARIPGKFIQFPRYDIKCELDASWGINPDLPYDCGNPDDGWLKKGAWPGMAQKWPCAFQTLMNISFDNANIAEVAARVDYDKESIDHVARDWLSRNKPIWVKWIPEKCRTSLD